MTNKKLSTGHKHILSLIRKGAKEDGWAPVSKFVAPIFSNKEIPGGAVPEELCEFEAVGDGGRARLTPMGESILDAMEWL